jgi:hypothetical protein
MRQASFRTKSPFPCTGRRGKSFGIGKGGGFNSKVYLFLANSKQYFDPISIPPGNKLLYFTDEKKAVLCGSPSVIGILTAYVCRLFATAKFHGMQSYAKVWHFGQGSQMAFKSRPTMAALSKYPL